MHLPVNRRLLLGHGLAAAITRKSPHTAAHDWTEVDATAGHQLISLSDEAGSLSMVIGDGSRAEGCAIRVSR